MGVDKTGSEELAGGVDDLDSVGRGNVRCNALDDLAGDENVGTGGLVHVAIMIVDASATDQIPLRVSVYDHPTPRPEAAAANDRNRFEYAISAAPVPASSYTVATALADVSDEQALRALQEGR